MLVTSCEEFSRIDFFEEGVYWVYMTYEAGI